VSEKQEIELPVNYEAERALIASLIHNNLTLDKIRHFLGPQHFADPVYSAVYRAICTVVDAGKVADHITLREPFSSDEILCEVGGKEFLQELVASLITIVNAEHYADLIYNLYLRRQMIHIGQELASHALQGPKSAEPLATIVDTEEALYKLQNDRIERSSFFQPFKNLLQATMVGVKQAAGKTDEVAGLTTGFRDLDNILVGMHPSDLIILAARPAMGKTALATNIAFCASRYLQNAARKNATVAYFSLEMSGEQLAARILSSESRISTEFMRKGRVTAKDIQTLQNVTQELEQLPLYVDDTPALTIADIKSRCRRLSLMHKGIGLIVIDYLQLIHGGRSDSRVQEISEITRGLKMLAKEMNAPVLALSQLSRAVEQRDDKTPRLADLRESGSIEQDADVVLFIYRKAYYQKDPLPEALSDADVVVAKHRNGPIGRVKLYFDHRTTTFKNAAFSTE